MTTDTERYVAATIRTLAPDMQADVRTELEASIADAVEARIDGGEPRDDAERAVLTELGDPDVLAAGYADRSLQLIGPRHYLMWWRLLRLLWWTITPVAVVAQAIATVIEQIDASGIAATSSLVGELIGSAIVTIITVVVHVGFWTTLVFVILERAGARTESTWSVDDLPEPDGDGAGRGDLIGSLVSAGLFAGALVWDQLVGFARTPAEWLPVLSPALWPWGIGFALASLAVTALLAISVFASGGWTRRAAAVNAVVCVAFAAVTIAVIATGGLLNPAFVDAFLSPPAEIGTLVALGIVTVGVAAWSAIDGFVKARRAQR